MSLSLKQAQGGDICAHGMGELLPRDVPARTQLSRAVLYELIQIILFGKRTSLRGTQCVQWRISVIRRWVELHTGQDPSGAYK